MPFVQDPQDGSTPPTGGVAFFHPNPVIGPFVTKLPPSSVGWTYNMNTSEVDTIGGQVIQILSVNFDTLTITGRFGKGGIADLRAMMHYFATYFSVASQGGIKGTTAEFVQEPISITYSGALDVPIDTGVPETWQVYPTSFPSFNRSLINIAPEWSVTCEVFEQPDSIVQATAKAELAQITRLGVGYTPNNVFSDPAGIFVPGQDLSHLSQQQRQSLIDAAKKQFNENADSVWAKLQGQLPAYTDADLQHLLQMQASLPAIVTPASTAAANAFKQKIK